TFCSTFGSSYYLQRVHGWDRTSAFLAGSPGALSQISILAVERGADLPGIAVVQTMRVIILTAALPMVLA
ncbi:AbrB family transcriptional regulator, partial [Escherichia coli]|uniref:AbrB family transcriptional regulator n=2 Tax=Pseudomonadota TaxID=1224 RepID=UPI003CE559F8